MDCFGGLLQPDKGHDEAFPLHWLLLDHDRGLGGLKAEQAYRH